MHRRDLLARNIDPEKDDSDVEKETEIFSSMDLTLNVQDALEHIYEEAYYIAIEPKDRKNYIRMYNFLSKTADFVKKHPQQQENVEILTAKLIDILDLSHKASFEARQRDYYVRVDGQQEDVPSDGNCFFWACARQLIHLLQTNPVLVAQLPELFVITLKKYLPTAVASKELQEILFNPQLNAQVVTSGVLVTSLESVFQLALRITTANQLSQFILNSAPIHLVEETAAASVVIKEIVGISSQSVMFIRDLLNGAIADRNIVEQRVDEHPSMTNLRQISDFLATVQAEFVEPTQKDLANLVGTIEKRDLLVQQTVNAKLAEQIKITGPCQEIWNKTICALKSLLLTNGYYVGDEAARLMSKLFANIAFRLESHREDGINITHISQYYLAGARKAPAKIPYPAPVIYLIKLPWAHYNSAGLLLQKTAKPLPQSAIVEGTIMRKRLTLAPAARVDSSSKTHRIEFAKTLIDADGSVDTGKLATLSIAVDMIKFMDMLFDETLIQGNSGSAVARVQSNPLPGLLVKATEYVGSVLSTNPELKTSEYKSIMALGVQSAMFKRPQDFPQSQHGEPLAPDASMLAAANMAKGFVQEGFLSGHTDHLIAKASTMAPDKEASAAIIELINGVKWFLEVVCASDYDPMNSPLLYGVNKSRYKKGERLREWLENHDHSHKNFHRKHLRYKKIEQYLNDLQTTNLIKAQDWMMSIVKRVEPSAAANCSAEDFLKFNH